jgi:hypothetical protein
MRIDEQNWLRLTRLFSNHSPCRTDPCLWGGRSHPSASRPGCARSRRQMGVSLHRSPLSEMVHQDQSPSSALVSACHPYGKRVTHVWNVIEGHQNGVSVSFSTALSGRKRQQALHYYRVPDRTESLRDSHVTRSRNSVSGWTVVHGVWFLHFSCTMGVERLDRYVKELRVGSVSEVRS